MMAISINICFLLSIIGYCAAFKLQVETQYGVIEGVQLEPSRNGKSVIGYLGIPYANPPKQFQVIYCTSTMLVRKVLSIIFFSIQESQIFSDKWDDVRPAKEFGSVCTQWSSVEEQIIGSDDCLFLNIYRPDVS